MMQNINLYHLVSSLSLAIDLAECSLIPGSNVVEDVSNINYSTHKFANHSRRTTYIAMKLAEAISSDEEFIRNVYIASSLHDIGATSSIDEAHQKSSFIYQHTIKGSMFIKKLPIDNKISEFVKYHHENFDGSGLLGASGDEIPIISQIIRLADMFELLYDESRPNFFQRNEITSWILKKKSTIFSPYLVDLLIQLQSKDAFWCDIENLGIIPNIMNHIRPTLNSQATLKDFKDIAVVFSDIIDAKSPFTFEHSTNLAGLINAISDYMGYDNDKKTRYEIAALLHDIGKLAIPNSILNKNGKLDASEFTIMRSHTYYTRIVLEQIEGFDEIVDWAANHHEKLNGTGYPLSLKADDLSLEERIMAVCDIYEALTAKRPYKKGMDKLSAFNILDQIVERGELCSKAVSILKEVI